jgi:hypothetical protein
LIAIARYLGVPPWELERQPQYWQSWAQTAMAAEAMAEKELSKKRLH